MPFCASSEVALFWLGSWPTLGQRRGARSFNFFPDNALKKSRVGHYHDRVYVNNHNDKLFSCTDKGLGSTPAVCARVDLS